MQKKDTEQYRQLKNILTQMFQLDQAELDFGIYRIMNQKRAEINAFLEDDLLTQILDVLQSSGAAEVKGLKAEIEKLEQTLTEAGMNPDESQKVQEMRAEYSKGGSVEAMELDIYSRLTQFFKRYYKEGDFISQRRYKEGVYAIPYEGEEVKLHWANHDQYYIKTGENFKNYSFKADRKTIHFVLKEADTERDNNKAQAGKERRFKLYQGEENPVFEETENGELNIYFTYEPADKKEKQKDLNQQTVATLTEVLPGKWTQILLQKKPTNKNKNRTLLEARLADYTAKNSFDYFIHKDLGKFLRQELDFYIKNEILHLDDINLDGQDDFQKQLTLVKAFKKVALKIIAFLAQLEDFQKKLFLKKKMVLQSDYCITLDRIDESFYPDIAKNERQLEEWKGLFATDEIEGFKEGVRESAVETLKANPYLLVDTQFFPTEWKYELLATLPDIDEQCDGLLINSENFQALNMLQERYREQVDTVYIDPPYNTGNDGFLYRDNFKRSSWLTFIINRLEVIQKIMNKEANFFSSIDNREQANLKKLLNRVFDSDNFVETFLWTKTSTPPALADKSRKTLEYVHCFEKNKNNTEYTGSLISNGDAPLINYGNPEKELLFPSGSIKFNIEDGVYKEDGKRKIKIVDDIIVKNGRNAQSVRIIGNFKWQQSTVDLEIKKGTYFLIKSELFSIRFQRKDSGRYKAPNNNLNIELNQQNNVDTNETSNKELINFGLSYFDYAKPTSLIQKLLSFNLIIKNAGVVLDYFAGSGTTAHAVINLNREDGGNRKYILVEMGEYFNTVTKPRVQKVIYNEEWDNGQPVNRKGSSHCFKYMRLESYEDTLNNLYLKKGEVDAAMQEEYLLKYALNVESRDSLLMLEAFKKPFGYKIKSTENNELKETEVDLVETFNYLIGLQVKTMEIIRGYVVITGETLEEKQVLVIWRDIEQHSNADLNAFCKKMKFNPLDGEFDQIYVNGDNNIENLKTGEERWKVNLIAHEFHRKMWEE